jgi:hypothetical protein
MARLAILVRRAKAKRSARMNRKARPIVTPPPALLTQGRRFSSFSRPSFERPRKVAHSTRSGFRSNAQNSA